MMFSSSDISAVPGCLWGRDFAAQTGHVSPATSAECWRRPDCKAISHGDLVLGVVLSKACETDGHASLLQLHTWRPNKAADALAPAACLRLCPDIARRLAAEAAPRKDNMSRSTSSRRAILIAGSLLGACSSAVTPSATVPSRARATAPHSPACKCSCHWHITVFLPARSTF